MRANQDARKVRWRNDTFYDDYLHRGDFEAGEFHMMMETPLRAMSYYDYGVHVKVVPGGCFYFHRT